MDLDLRNRNYEYLESITMDYYFSSLFYSFNFVFYSFKYVLGIENENLDYFLNFGSFISLLFGYFIIWWFLVRKNVDFTFEQKDKPNYSLFLIISLIFIGLYFSERPFINLYNDLFYNKKIA